MTPILCLVGWHRWQTWLINLYGHRCFIEECRRCPAIRFRRRP